MTPRGSDALALSRRIDWRWLLPDEHLGEVLVAGADAPELVEALGQVTRGVTVEGQRPVVPPGPSPHLLVLHAPTRRQARRAVERLDDDGVVYVELPAGVTAGASGALTPRSAVRLLRTAGFDPPVLHLHWPSFEACQEIVPLADPRSVELFLRRRRTWLVAPPPVARAVRWGMSRVLPVSVLARRRGWPDRAGADGSRP